MDTNPTDVNATDNPPLKRALGLTSLTLYGLGTIIGAGIYVLVGAVAARAGMAAPLSLMVSRTLKSSVKDSP